jgi:DNA-binding NarL/FixJ family response regulator
MDKIHILIADDHSLVRTGIRNVLKEFPDLEIVAEAADGSALFAALAQTEPDCLLIDVTMPEFEPIKAVRQIRARYPTLKILVISAYDDDMYVQGLLGAGVDGYHLKDQPLSDLRLAVERVLAGEKWLSSRLVNKLISYSIAPSATPPLTTRQRDLLRLLQQGLDNQAMARRLGLSVKTVENNLTRLYRYLEVQSRLEAVHFVMQHPEILALATEQAAIADVSLGGWQAHRLTILLVDDSARYRSELCQMVSLVHPGAITYEAENIGEAVHLAQRINPQLVFVDMILGKESGIQCTQRLAALSSISRIILISAYPDREFHRLGLEAGALAFLDKKDLDIAALRQVIADVIP